MYLLLVLIYILLFLNLRYNSLLSDQPVTMEDMSPYASEYWLKTTGEEWPEITILNRLIEDFVFHLVTIADTEDPKFNKR